uniref:Uncharacterized protein n=1 Tax=Neogobius melanostomus TaxID=47308 RepID=A0A8C6TS49_9GOBI
MWSYSIHFQQLLYVSDLLQTFVPTSLLFARSLLTWDSAMSALSSASSYSCWSLRNLIRLFIYPGLQFLHLLLASLQSDLFSLIQTVLQVSTGVLLFLQLLCHHGRISDGLLGLSFISAASLRIKGALKGVYNSLLVSFGLLHLFIFLSQLTLNFSLYLVELKLNSQNLSLLMLQRGLE